MDAPFSIIDAHQHLWDLSRFRLPWIVPGSTLGRSHTLADYKRAARGVGIAKTLYMEVDVEPSQQREETDFVLETCRLADSGMVGGVVAGRPASPTFRHDIEQFRGSPFIKGIRQILHGPSTPTGFCLDPAFISGIRELGKSNLCFDVCMRVGELSDAVRLIGACPETRFVLDHCGNPQVHDALGATPDRSQWRKDISALAKLPNVVCKVSGLVNTARRGAWGPEDLAPIVNHVRDEFGPDRLIFASDWPVCTTTATLAEWLHALRAVVAHWPMLDQTKLFHDNATRFYGLN